jgi:NADH-quinone oxidoreductase subunit N
VDLLTLFVSMELSSYSLYLLSALRLDHRNAESSIKYLILGGAGSGIFLWGAGFVVGLARSASFADLAQSSASGNPLFVMGLVFVLFAFFFKLSAAPMHFWAPDVYESAPTPVTNFIATASKAAAVAILVRLLVWCPVSSTLTGVLGVVAFISMTLGNTAALLQKDVKRLLAYSSIAQAGYLLVGLLTRTPEGYASALFYAFAYLLMNAGVFLVVLLVAKALKHDNPQLDNFDGLAERSPKLALLLLLSLLSLAGIPPLAGFTGKWILFSAAMDRGHWFLVLWAVLNSVVSLFYYLTLAKHVYLEKPAEKGPLVLTEPIKLLSLGLLVSIIALGLFPSYFITLAQHAAASVLNSA